jgi:pimeloyl-ACP methyl ester carboxylesterase
VLVHGAWSGGWGFRFIADRLRAAGHDVFVAHLTGLGERVHLASPGITLTTHINDVVGMIDAESLDDIILVGHSYGGMVITGVADRLPERIAALVYLDAIVPKDGESAMVAVAAGAGAAPPPPSGDVMPLTSALAEMVGIPASLSWRYTPQPMRTMTQPIHLTGAHATIRTKIYVRALHFPGMAATYARIQTEPGWEFEEIEASHNLMYDAPDKLAALLDAMS